MPAEGSKASDLGVNLTAAAVTKIKELLAQEPKPGLRLRIVVMPGGCAGLKYQLFFSDEKIPGDSVFDVGSNSSNEHSVSDGLKINDGEPSEQAQPESLASEQAVEVIIDAESLPYLSNATINYSDDPDSQGFTIDNPNSTSSCACGKPHH
ncbi:HesB/IscA family protein [Streptomyces kaempferi]|uniref:HesB/IscA family protein n=1 Tax=Streptomyces kaempferi TaxID=333725 RepID=A0ABW3XX91_9ACTN